MVFETVPKDILDLLTAGITTTNPWKELADNGTFHAAENGGHGSNTFIVYTVPANTVFYLTSATLAYVNDGVPSSASVNMKVNGKEMLMMDPPDQEFAHDVTTSNPTVPIKLTATQTITVTSDDAGTLVRGTIGGYEIAA